MTSSLLIGEVLTSTSNSGPDIRAIRLRNGYPSNEVLL